MIIAKQQTVVIVQKAVRHAVVSVGTQGPRGPAATETISADLGNQLTQGSDEKLFVPAPQLASAQW